eukprot:3190390-Pleurochrysis_carterae.AAC.2
MKHQSVELTLRMHLRDVWIGEDWFCCADILQQLEKKTGICVSPSVTPAMPTAAYWLLLCAQCRECYLKF